MEGVKGTSPSAAPGPIPASARGRRDAAAAATTPPIRRVRSSRVTIRQAAPQAACASVSSAASAGSRPAGKTSATSAPAVAARVLSSSACAGSNGSVPAVSISTGAPSWRRASARARLTGWLATSRGTPRSRVKAASCSVAPARLPSVVMTTGAMPLMTSRVASRAAVSVLPAPGGPVSITGGSRGFRDRVPNGKLRPIASVRSPRASPGCRAAGTPCHAKAARRAARRAGSGARSGARSGGGGGSGSGSSAAVISTPPAIRRVFRISASAPSSARTRAMASAMPEARKDLRRMMGTRARPMGPAARSRPGGRTRLYAR